MPTDCVAAFLRAERAKIVKLWASEVARDHHPLGADRGGTRTPSRPVLFDRIEQFLSGLADWVEGDAERGECAFRGLVEGPALQRLGYGVGLETLAREYSKLRVVLVRQLLGLVAKQDCRESIVRMHEGMDQALGEAMHRYAARREEVRDRFISILGHDLREPLSTIVISSRVLAANPALESEYRVVASRIGRACNRMQRMIDDVLDFARGHLGSGIPASPTPNDMGEILRAAADEMIGANPQRQITVEIRGDLKCAFDRDRVHQAITNLISNAVHHTDDSIEIRAYEGDDGETVVTEVTSHGEPIPEDIQRMLFDPFAHFDATHPRRGLGLGLYIVQQIALAHGGQCEVQSERSGTTFRIRWPRSSGQTPSLKEPDSGLAGGGSNQR